MKWRVSWSWARVETAIASGLLLFLALVSNASSIRYCVMHNLSVQKYGRECGQLSVKYSSALLYTWRIGYRRQKQRSPKVVSISVYSNLLVLSAVWWLGRNSKINWCRRPYLRGTLKGKQKKILLGKVIVVDILIFWPYFTGKLWLLLFPMLMRVIHSCILCSF